METQIPETCTKKQCSAKWTRKIRQLTNERIINLPKQIDFHAGEKVTLVLDGEKIIVERVEK